MGMYHQFKFSAKIKPEYISMVTALTTPPYTESYWGDFSSVHPSIENFAKLPRSRCIPLMSNCSDDWKNKLETDVWTVHCEFKNYDDEIDVFATTVLAEIAEKLYYCNDLYEENDVWGSFTMKDGKIKRTKHSYDDEKKYDWKWM